MKKLSIYILYSFTILVLILGFDVAFQYWTTLDYYRGEFENRLKYLDKETALADQFAKGPDGLKTLTQYLNDRLTTGSFNFWIIFHGANVIASSQKNAGHILYRAENFVLDGEARTIYHPRSGEYIYCVTQLPAHLKLVVGLVKAEQPYIKMEMQVITGTILRFLVGMLVISIGTFAFFFRDITRSIRALSGRHRGRAQMPGSALSKEADLLARGLAAFDTHAEELQKQKDLYRWQVLPSLRSELESGIEPPYDFACTLVRSDINNFTKIYNSHSVSDFMATINEFFAEVTHTVSRYGGYIHEFVGDEVIYYFKDDEVGNSVAIALAAISDINQVAARFHQKMTIERGYPFTIKSSLAYDRLRFGRLVNAHSLSGPSLIETVRILSSVTEKDGNVVIFDERHRQAVSEVMSSEFYADVALKGFNDERRLYRLLARRPVREFCVWDEVKSWRNLTYYRADDELESILEWLRQTWKDASVDDVLHVIGLMRPLAVTRSNLKPLDVLKAWLAALMAVRESDASYNQASRILASAIRLVENFACEVEDPRGKGNLTALLERASRHLDRRVTANSVEVLATLRILPSERLEAFSGHNDNRVAANALVGAGQREITPFVLKELGKMLSAKNHWRVASGLYALGEIARFHRERNLVYYNTQVEFLELVAEIPKFARHEFEGCRRQALGAARKINDPDIIRKMPEPFLKAG